jgi:hypothetical protein
VVRVGRVRRRNLRSTSRVVVVVVVVFFGLGWWVARVMGAEVGFALARVVVAVNLRARVRRKAMVSVGVD